MADSYDYNTAPTASQRKKCWETRDFYFACLDSKADDESSCKELFEEFKKACPTSWIKHFKKKREDEKKLQAELKKHNATLIKLG